MPDTTPLHTRAQMIFLRAFRQPAGPSTDQWPSPAILRRWLRRPTFRRALASVQDSLRLQSDFQLASAATRATARLASFPQESPDKPQSQSESLSAAESILRLAHVRQRFAAVEARHDTTQALTAELEQAQSEIATLRTQLAEAKEKLKFTVRLDPYIFQHQQNPPTP